MKKFDLEAAKNGAAVCLNDGTPVYIIDFDFNGRILCKTKGPGAMERMTVFCIDESGESVWPVNLNVKRSYRLQVFMAPVYAYACIYKDPMTGVLSTNYLHQTLVDAKANRLHSTEDREFYCHARIEMFFKEEQEGGENEE